MNANEYIKHWEKNKVWTHLRNPKHQARFAECVKHIKGETFADIGCAYGHSTLIMAGMRPGKWFGVDFSEVAITKASEHSGDKGVDFVYAPDSAALGVEMYDSVVCSEVIEHVPNDTGFVRDVVASARRAAVFTTPNKQVNDPGHLRLYDQGMLDVLFMPYRATISKAGPFWVIVVNKK